MTLGYAFWDKAFATTQLPLKQDSGICIRATCISAPQDYRYLIAALPTYSGRGPGPSRTLDDVDTCRDHRSSDTIHRHRRLSSSMDLLFLVGTQSSAEDSMLDMPEVCSIVDLRHSSVEDPLRNCRVGGRLDAPNTLLQL